MRRAAQKVVPSAGAPSSRSTANPSRRASQHSASHRPAGAWPGGGRPGGGDWLPGCLRQVPDVGDPVGIPPGRRRLVVVTLVTVLRSSGGGPGRDAEGLDAVLVAADLPSGRGPLPVVPDHGGAGPLGGDEQDVREVLAGHERGQAQPRGPVAGGAQCQGVLVQAGAERGQLPQALVLPGQSGCGGTRGHHWPPGGPAAPDPGSCPGSREARAVSLPLTRCAGAAGPPGVLPGAGGELASIWPEAAASSPRRLWLATR